MRHRCASVLGDGAFDVRRDGVPNGRAIRHVRAVVGELVQPARLELPLLDPQVARELGIVATGQALSKLGRLGHRSENVQ